MNRIRNLTVMTTLLLLAVGPGIAQGQIAVVVNTHNPVDDVSVQELERLFLGKTSVFANGDQVQLATLDDSAEVFCSRVLGMTPNQFRRHWIKAVFAGTRSLPPEPFKGAAEVLSFVAANKGAVAIIGLGDVDDSVKVLLIDGKAPGQADYFLQNTK